MKPQSKSSTELPILYFERQPDWAAWLSENHATSPGVWLELAKKGADAPSVSYYEAVEIWLDRWTKASAQRSILAPEIYSTLGQKCLVEDNGIWNTRLRIKTDIFALSF